MNRRQYPDLLRCCSIPAPPRWLIWLPWSITASAAKRQTHYTLNKRAYSSVSKKKGFSGAVTSWMMCTMKRQDIFFCSAGCDYSFAHISWASDKKLICNQYETRDLDFPDNLSLDGWRGTWGHRGPPRLPRLDMKPFPPFATSRACQLLCFVLDTLNFFVKCRT